MNRLLELRKENHISQERLAEYLDTTQQQISRYERKEALMDEAMIVKCCRYFRVTVDYFLCQSDTRYEIEYDMAYMNRINQSGLIEFIDYLTKQDMESQTVAAEVCKTIQELVQKLSRIY